MQLLKTAPTRLLLALSLCFTGCEQASQTTQGPLSVDWPPVVGQRYPDLELKNAQGETVQLSSLEGQVLLIEPIGMT